MIEVFSSFGIVQGVSACNCHAVASVHSEDRYAVTPRIYSCVERMVSLARVCSFLCGVIVLLLALLLANHPSPVPRSSPGDLQSIRRPQLQELALPGTNSSRVRRALYLIRQADGMPQVHNIGVAIIPLRELHDGEVLIQSSWLSVDPYMRGSLGYRGQVLPPINTSALDVLDQLAPRFLGGEGLGVVVESRAPSLPPKTVVRGRLGWSDWQLLRQEEVEALQHFHQPISTALGIVGNTGRTAFHGVSRILEPRAGEVMFVSGAAGATGAVAGQLGKIAGCHVIGSAGSAEKVQHLYELGFDGAFNYREENAFDALERLAPDGIDLIFENTGGMVSEAAVHRLRNGGRIAISGLIDWYHDAGDLLRALPKLLRVMLPYSTRSALHGLFNPSTIPRSIALKLFTHLTIALSQGEIFKCDRQAVTNQAPAFSGVNFSAENFLVDCFDKDTGKAEAEMQLGNYLRDGRLKHQETVIEGALEDVPHAFIQMLGGANKGKMLVKLLRDAA